MRLSFFQKNYRQTLVHLFSFVFPISNFFVQVEVPRAAGTRKQFEPFGSAVMPFDVSHERLTDPSVLMGRVHYQLPDATRGAHDPASYGTHQIILLRREGGARPK